MAARGRASARCCAASSSRSSIVRLPRVAPFLSGIALLASACSGSSESPPKETITDGRVVIDTDVDRLGAAVDARDELVSIEAAAAPNARAYVPPTDYVLTLVAEVAPP